MRKSLQQNQNEPLGHSSGFEGFYWERSLTFERLTSQNVTAIGGSMHIAPFYSLSN